MKKYAFISLVSASLLQGSWHLATTNIKELDMGFFDNKNINSVFKYSTNGWLTYKPTQKDNASLKTLKSGDGFWISGNFVDSQKIIFLNSLLDKHNNGNEYKIETSITKGWNLIGAITDIPTENLKNSKSYTYENDKYEINLPTIKKGSGFWIKSDNEFVLSQDDRTKMRILDSISHTPIYGAKFQNYSSDKDGLIVLDQYNFIKDNISKTGYILDNGMLYESSYSSDDKMFSLGDKFGYTKMINIEPKVIDINNTFPNFYQNPSETLDAIMLAAGAKQSTKITSTDTNYIAEIQSIGLPSSITVTLTKNITPNAKDSFVITAKNNFDSDKIDLSTIYSTVKPYIKSSLTEIIS
jgi:hypothetical protein